MPARLRKIASAAAEYDIQIVKPRSGSHWKAKKKGFFSYTIPAHNGMKTEIGDEYIKGLCRNFKLDPGEFYGKL